MKEIMETAIIDDGIVYKWDRRYLPVKDTVFCRCRFLDRGERYYFDDCYWMILK